MEAKYRAQIIILKKALAEKKEIIKRLHDYPLLSFLDSIQIALDFACYPINQVLTILYQFLNSFENYLQLGKADLPGMENISGYIKVLSQRFTLIQVKVYSINAVAYSVISRLLNTLGGLWRLLHFKLENSEAVRKYLALIGYLLVEIRNSMPIMPLILARSHMAESWKKDTSYSLIQALVQNAAPKKPVESKEFEVQTDFQESPIVDIPADEKQSLPLIRLHKYSSTIQELRSKLYIESDRQH